MTISTALKKLHEKMTGKIATANTAGALINELADNYTAPDTGGGDVFVVHGELRSGPGYEYYTRDATFAEIKEAIESGKVVIIRNTINTSSTPKVSDLLLAGVYVLDGEVKSYRFEAFVANFIVSANQFLHLQVVVDVSDSQRDVFTSKAYTLTAN